MKRDLDREIDLRLPELKRRERSFEYALRDELSARAVAFVKLKPTIEGFPDRLAIGWSKTQLVECKRKDGELSETQRLMIRKLEKLGITVMVVEGPDVRAAADAICRRLRKR